MADIFVKKTWSDRIAEYITRRTLTKEDGSTEIVTVERNEGEISQEGDAFDAATMNDLEDRIASGFETINGDLAKIEENINVDKWTFLGVFSNNEYCTEALEYKYLKIGFNQSSNSAFFNTNEAKISDLTENGITRFGAYMVDSLSCSIMLTDGKIITAGGKAFIWGHN